MYHSEYEENLLKQDEYAKNLFSIKEKIITEFNK